MAQILTRSTSIDDDGRIIFGRYTGPALPFGATPELVLGPKRDVLVIVTSMALILTTPKGTIPHRPNTGSFVPWLLFRAFTDTTLNLIRYYTAKDLSEQEPRIVVRSVVTERIGDRTVKVTPAFQIVGDPEGNVHNAPLTLSKGEAI
jgi:phage baseplate assembly protein W